MKDKKKLLKEIGSWLLVFVGSLALALILETTVFAKVRVEQSSMENTLFDRQQLIVDKLSYNFTEPKRGDIIIFYRNRERGNLLQEMYDAAGNLILSFNKNREEAEIDKALVKRIIGIPGDVIDIKDGLVYLNGEPLEEAYVNGETLPKAFSLPVTVGKKQLFVLGDHRTVSEDSRAFGPINYDQVIGKAFFRVYPFDTIGKLK
jgi:signal peptidase I